jgi:hypothetical protein
MILNKNIICAFKHIIVMFLLFSCSPYKKITIPADTYFTNHWKGANEVSVIKSMGEYKTKVEEEKGYYLLFDYTFTLVNKSSTPVPVNNGQQVGHLDKNNRPILVAQQPLYINDARNRRPDNTLEKFIEFHFDSTQRVKYVYAVGFPDSVYYKKR